MLGNYICLAIFAKSRAERHVNTEIELLGAYPIYLNKLQVFFGGGLLFFFYGG